MVHREKKGACSNENLNDLSQKLYLLISAQVRQVDAKFVLGINLWHDRSRIKCSSRSDRSRKSRSLGEARECERERSRSSSSGKGSVDT